jgi:hypothetical protein
VVVRGGVGYQKRAALGVLLGALCRPGCFMYLKAMHVAAAALPWLMHHKLATVWSFNGRGLFINQCFCVWCSACGSPLLLLCCSAALLLCLCLQDLSEYKRFRDKEVATAARGLIGAFRELNPGAGLRV